MSLICSRRSLRCPSSSILIDGFILVSNEVPEQPVLSPVSGCIYEKRLIIKYLHESPTDPVTGQPLTEEQLIDVKGELLSMKYSTKDLLRLQSRRWENRNLPRQRASRQF